MAHHIDSMFSGSNETPWHRLGTVVAGAPTSADAIRLAGLDWRVKLHDLRAVTTREEITADGVDVVESLQDVDSHKAVIREDRGTVLGVVGKDWTPLQNADAFTFLDSVAADDSIRYETAGALKGGRLVWLLARLDAAAAEPQPGDKVLPYLLLSMAHDGTRAVRCLLTTIRVVCWNTLSVALRAAERADKGTAECGWTWRHTSNLESRMRQARNAIAQACESFGAWSHLARQLQQTEPTPSDARAIMLAAFPELADLDSNDATTRQKKAREGLIESIMVNWRSDKRQAGASRTAWGLVNAITQHVDHDSRARSDENRLQSAWFGPGAEIKRAAWDSAVALLD